MKAELISLCSCRDIPFLRPRRHPSAAGKVSLTDASGFKLPSLLPDPVHGPLLQPCKEREN